MESVKVMKRTLGLIGIFLASVAMVMPVRGADTNVIGKRLGVYDSRVVAYAWFCSDAQQAKLKEQVAIARAAKEAGDTNKFKEYSAALRAKQDQMHREVFSTAPAAEALATLKGRIPEIEQAAGVAHLVSKWDKPSLNQYAGAETVDVTDTLVNAFLQPTKEQLKVIASIKRLAPLPLDQCNELIRTGKI